MRHLTLVGLYYRPGLLTCKNDVPYESPISLLLYATTYEGGYQSYGIVACNYTTLPPIRNTPWENRLGN